MFQLKCEGNRVHLNALRPDQEKAQTNFRGSFCRTLMKLQEKAGSIDMNE
jgi:hypothetical protein